MFFMCCSAIWFQVTFTYCYLFLNLQTRDTHLSSWFLLGRFFLFFLFFYFWILNFWTILCVLGFGYSMRLVYRCFDFFQLFVTTKNLVQNISFMCCNAIWFQVIITYWLLNFINAYLFLYFKILFVLYVNFLVCRFPLIFLWNSE